MLGDDLTPFFSTNDFAESVTIGGVGGVGIFNNEFLGVETGAISAGSAEPTLTVRAADFPSVARGTSVLVRATNYLVYGPPEPDGTGVVLLRLRKA